MTKRLIIAIIVISLLGLIAVLVGAAAPADRQEAARLNNIGVAYMNQQLFEKALKSFNEAAGKNPDMKVTTLNRGVALMNLQRVDEAKALLEQAAKDDPTDPHAFYNLGLIEKNSSDAEAAVKDFRKVTEIDPNDADAWYFLGSTYAQRKQFPEAISAFEHTLKLDPLHASAQFGLARAYQQSGQTDPAREAMKRFQYVTQNKLGSPISLVYGEQGKYSRAEESPVAVSKVPDEIPIRFVEATSAAGLAAEPGNLRSPQGPGACFLDYDNDGRIDLLLADNGPSGGLALFRNLGNKFEDVTQKSGLGSYAGFHAFGCAVGDYDNDGATDIVVLLAGHVILLRNEKDGTFKDVTKTAGMKDDGFNAAATFVDYDHDGDLDLYVTDIMPWGTGSHCDNETGTTAGASGPHSPPIDPLCKPVSRMWRNNGNGTFTDVTDERGLSAASGMSAIGTDYNNDRAIDIAASSEHGPPIIFQNPREGKFPALRPWSGATWTRTIGIAAVDFDHDGWMDLVFSHDGVPGITLWQNRQGKIFEQVPLPKVDWTRAFGVVAFDYDNDGWVDLAAVGETKDGKGEVRLFRNLGPDGWKDVSADVGLDKIQLKEPRAIIAGDYDNDGAVDLLITQNHGPAVLLRNEGGNKNNWLRLALKGLNDNKSAIGTKVEVFSAGLRQKFEVYGSSGYLGQNSPYLTIGLGQSKEADVVRMLWPTGVLQDEIEVAANKRQDLLEIDRRGSSCPTLFAWDGTHYALVGDMLGAGVVGHWVGPGERNIARPVEYIKIDRALLRGKEETYLSGFSEKGRGPSTPQGESLRASSCSAQDDSAPCPGKRVGMLSFRFMEPLEESVYLDQVELLAVDHPVDVDVYPNEYFASNPPYPPFKLVFSRDARPPAGAWDEHGHNVLPDLLAHRYFGDFTVLSFPGFTEPHSLELDLGEPYRGGPLWLLMHGEIEYFTATSMYAAHQAHLAPFAPYVDALNEKGNWVRVIDDLGFPAGGARTMTADLTGKLPLGTERIRLTTNLQIYWDNILISRTPQGQPVRLTPVPLARADLGFHGFPLKIEGQPPGNVQYIYEKASPTGPYTRPAGAYTRYGDVRALLNAADDKFAVFGSGDAVALDFDPVRLPALPQGWVRDYLFAAHGYEKDMDFYAYHGDTVEPLPYRDMGTYPYPGKSYPADADHMNYQLEYNTRFMSGKEANGYSFQYPK